MKKHQHRRTFLKQLFTGSMATLALPTFADSLVATSSELNESLSNLSPADEAYWELVKKQFAVPGNKIMMNAANLCPSPYFVNEKVQNAFAQLEKDVSSQFRLQFSETRKKSLDVLASFLGVTREEVGITRNTTEANSIIVTGLDLKAGDEVIIWDQNHPSNREAWEQRAKRIGFTVKKIAIPLQATKAEALEVFEKAITAKTKLMAFSHISNTNGFAVPAEEICRLARTKKITTLVDGAQSFGMIDFDLRKMGCDFYTSSTHKWLMGPLENGVLYIKRELIPNVWPATISAGWKDTGITVDEKFCVLGQRNDTTGFALPEIIEFHQTLGRKNIESRVRQLSQYLQDQIKTKLPQATLLSPVTGETSAGVVIVELSGKKPQEVVQKLYEEHGIAAANTGGVRLSPHIYNTMGDIDRVVSALATLAL